MIVVPYAQCTTSLFPHYITFFNISKPKINQKLIIIWLLIKVKVYRNAELQTEHWHNIGYILVSDHAMLYSIKENFWFLCKCVVLNA